MDNDDDDDDNDESKKEDVKRCVCEQLEDTLKLQSPISRDLVINSCIWKVGTQSSHIAKSFKTQQALGSLLQESIP